MNTRKALVLLMTGLLLGCAAVALGQQEDIDTYFGAWSIFPGIVSTIIWCAIYLPIYAACLMVPMAYLQRFTGVDANLLLLIGVLWLGGMAANAVGYGLAGDDRRWLAVLIIIPLVFGWCVLICTRDWADFSLREALVVAAVTALVCTPYFGPTWRVKPAPKAPEVLPEDTRALPRAPEQARLVPAPAPGWHHI